jgi:hypothetical protein
MRYWPAIFVPPLTFLTLLSTGYAIVPWACEHQTRAPLHWISAIALVIALAGMALAWHDWRSVGLKRPDDKGERASRLRLLCVVGLMLSGLSTLAVLSLWLTQFVIPPCVR